MTETTNPAGERYGLQQEARDPGPVGAESDAATPPGTIPAGAQTAQAQASTWTMVRELIETVVLSLIIFLLIRQVVQNYRIENHSMEPNFYEGQFVLVNKLAYRLGQPDARRRGRFPQPPQHQRRLHQAHHRPARRYRRGARCRRLYQRRTADRGFPAQLHSAGRISCRRSQWATTSCL